jgi:hypothetical protein
MTHRMILIDNMKTHMKEKYLRFKFQTNTTHVTIGWKNIFNLNSKLIQHMTPHYLRQMIRLQVEDNRND